MKAYPSLSPERALLVVVDIQEKLAPSMDQLDRLLCETERLIRGIRELNIPVLVSEQYPQGLGRTLASLLTILPYYQLVEKRSFSLLEDGHDEVMAFLREGRDQIILCGMETHVCIYQTARDLLARGLQVIIPREAVGSRTEGNKEAGLEALRFIEAQIFPVETILFDLLGTSLHPSFKAISQLIR